MTETAASRREPVPRGLGRTGPVILSYGFRPFFLAAGCWGVLAMALWIAHVSGLMEVGGTLGGLTWHAHEMLFGYSSAALAGFLLTAVPNWTGRLPVSGTPLLALFLVWFAGRLALFAPDVLGPIWSVLVDAAFLPLLLVICAREVTAGKKWKDLKVLAALFALSAANIAFHYSALTTGDISLPSRLAIAAYCLLIAIIGGRIIPSFTRNWVARNGMTTFPQPHSRFDAVAIGIALASFWTWIFVPEGLVTGAFLSIAGAVHAVRLWRWRGWYAAAERLVLILHLGYGFLVLGFFAAAAAAWGLMDPVSALHVLTVGTIGTMTLAVMTRATRGHTGLPLHAGPLTVTAYAAMAAAALVRPLVAFVPEFYLELVSAAGALWMLAFALFLLEYAPPLLRTRKDLPYKRGKDGG